MIKIHNCKTMRDVFAGWRQVKNKNNVKRLHMHRIKDKLREKPELGRPLLVLKNLLAFRAFNKLFEGARLVREEDNKTELANC